MLYKLEEGYNGRFQSCILFDQHVPVLVEPGAAGPLTNKVKGDRSVGAMAQHNALGSLEICLLVTLSCSTGQEPWGNTSFKIFTVTAKALNEIITIVLGACVHLAFLGKNASIHCFRSPRL